MRRLIVVISKLAFCKVQPYIAFRVIPTLRPRTETRRKWISILSCSCRPVRHSQSVRCWMGAASQPAFASFGVQAAKQPQLLEPSVNFISSTLQFEAPVASG